MSFYNYDTNSLKYLKEYTENRQRVDHYKKH